jgi:hypothetical protein
MCMYDLLKVSDGLIGHGDGMVNVNGRAIVLFIATLVSLMVTDAYRSRIPSHSISTVQRRSHHGEDLTLY